MIDYGTKNKYEGKVRPLVGAAYQDAERQRQENEAAVEKQLDQREKQLDQAGISVTECWGPRQTTSPEAGGPGDGEDDVYLAGKAGV